MLAKNAAVKLLHQGPRYSYLQDKRLAHDYYKKMISCKKITEHDITKARFEESVKITSNNYGYYIKR